MAQMLVLKPKKLTERLNMLRGTPAPSLQKLDQAVGQARSFVAAHVGGKKISERQGSKGASVSCLELSIHQQRH